MAQIFSNAHIDVVIDGSHRVTGFADEDRPYEFDDGSDRIAITRSRIDGGLYGTTNAKLGGAFTLRLAPNSPTAQWLIDRNEEQKRAIIDRSKLRIYTVTLTDSVQGRSTTMEGGFLVTCPDQVEAGQTFEVMWEFETITTNNAGATFAPPLDITSAA